MSDQVRLSVNIGSGTADALRSTAERRLFSVTTAVTVAISVWTAIEKERAKGGTIAVVRNGRIYELELP